MSKPWAKIGAWAEEAEQAEAEEREQAAKMAAARGGDSQSFPSLRDAVTTKPKKKKKMTLQEFTLQSNQDSAVGLSPAEMLRLPTGPKERSADEMQPGRLGGGFSSYGRFGGPPGGARDRDRDGDGGGSWGGNRRSYGGGFDDERRGQNSRVSDFDQPSRADEVDNWALGKKSLPAFDSGRSNRYGSLGGGGEGREMSRADEVDNWASMKKLMPARSSTFGSGFRNSGQEPERWTREALPEDGAERRRLVLDPPRGEGAPTEPVVVRTNKANPFGAARPREEILAEKGLDWKKLDLEMETKKTSRPPSSHSSRPSSVHSSRSEGPALQGTEQSVKPRIRVNPFGAAKPREVLLQERGMDWRKIDSELEHRGVDRPETEAEKNLREEIHRLKMELKQESNTESLQGARVEQILRKERELELLIHEFDDKVRFGPKATERPGSGAGRVAVFPERPPSRPPSQSGSYEESRSIRPGSGAGRVAVFPERPPSQSGRYEDSRSMEFMGRPRSRGRGEFWTMHGNDRRSFQGERERGFLGNRDIDRSRERW